MCILLIQLYRLERQGRYIPLAPRAWVRHSFTMLIPLKFILSSLHLSSGGKMEQGDEAQKTLKREYIMLETLVTSMNFVTSVYTGRWQVTEQSLLISHGWLTALPVTSYFTLGSLCSLRAHYSADAKSPKRLSQLVKKWVFLFDWLQDKEKHNPRRTLAENNINDHRILSYIKIQPNPMGTIQPEKASWS